MYHIHWKDDFQNDDTSGTTRRLLSWGPGFKPLIHPWIGESPIILTLGHMVNTNTFKGQGCVSTYGNNNKNKWKRMK